MHLPSAFDGSTKICSPLLVLHLVFVIMVANFLHSNIFKRTYFLFKDGINNALALSCMLPVFDSCLICACLLCGSKSTFYYSFSVE
ncbi:unnamed protein product [Prunus brigantina]